MGPSRGRSMHCESDEILSEGSIAVGAGRRLCHGFRSVIGRGRYPTPAGQEQATSLHGTDHRRPSQDHDQDSGVERTATSGRKAHPVAAATANPAAPAGSIDLRQRTNREVSQPPGSDRRANSGRTERRAKAEVQSFGRGTDKVNAGTQCGGLDESHKAEVKFRTRFGGPAHTPPRSRIRSSSKV